MRLKINNLNQYYIMRRLINIMLFLVVGTILTSCIWRADGTEPKEPRPVKVIHTFPLIIEDRSVMKDMPQGTTYGNCVINSYEEMYRHLPPNHKDDAAYRDINFEKHSVVSQKLIVWNRVKYVKMDVTRLDNKLSSYNWIYLSRDTVPEGLFVIVNVLTDTLPDNLDCWFGEKKVYD